MKVKILKKNHLDIPVGEVIECKPYNAIGVDVDASVCRQWDATMPDDGFQYFLSYDEVEVVDDEN